MRVGVTQIRFIGEGSFFRASSGIFLKAAWALYSSEKGSTIAGDLQASEIAKTIILVVNGKADVTVLFQSDELSPAFREHPELAVIYCIGTAYELYKQYGCERYVEMLHIINEAWKGNVDSYLAGVIRGVARFISVYEGEYSRERLVQQLARTHPKTITQLAQKDTGSSANRHMRQILRIYNGASREMSLPLKN